TDGFFIRAIPRIGLRSFKMADGPIGVRNFGPATTMAGGINLAATWNPALAERVGTQIGRDARAKGVHYLLGPGVNIYRSPRNGRNFEYFGEDPFLGSRIAVGYVKGVQSQGVSATIKHYMGNNSDFDRHQTDSIIDERTMREIYLPIFESAVKEAHVGAVMDSYNLINGEHATQNGFLNNDVLKKDWGFDGVLMSDWDATYDGVAAALGGLDLEMPSGRFMNRANLLEAVKSGKVPMSVIDDKVRRIIGLAARMGWLDRDQADLSIPRYNLDGDRVALQAAEEGMVLLKNDNSVLPLTRGKSIAVIGPLAYPAQPVGGGSAQVQPFAPVSFMEGITRQLSAGGSKVFYNQGIPTLSNMAQDTDFMTAAQDGKPGMNAEYYTSKDLSGPVSAAQVEHKTYWGPPEFVSPEKWLSVRWTGYYTPKSAGAHDIFVRAREDGYMGYRLSVDDKLVLDNWQYLKATQDYVTLNLDASPHKVVLEYFRNEGRGGADVKIGIANRAGIVDPDAKALAAKADAVVLAVGFDPDTETESADRTFRLPPGQEALINEIAAANKNVIVVVTAGGSVDMNEWLPKVAAVIQAWYPGQEGGTALAHILAGDVNPSGRLPVSFERAETDNPSFPYYYPEAGTKKIDYKEGIFTGYRGYEKSGKKPLFPFGYGLSYTTFAYRNLKVTPGANGTYTVSFSVSNTGKRAGAEVAQVYVGAESPSVPRPARELKGFTKVDLKPGESRLVTITLDPRSFSYYDIKSHQWKADPGNYNILVGRNVDQIELKGTATLK
ncbi:MAG TPA: glycoside hydrolase family 3 C-terminal domain-containing protein, partial [Terriglobales bacterium]